MSRRRASNSESLATSSMNEAMAYPFTGMQQSHTLPQRRGPIEGPGGRRLTRRVTWRSSTYKLMASLWVLGVLYMVWLIRDIFYLPFSYSSKHAINANAGDDLLAQYVGREECGISSHALYLPPHSNGGSVLNEPYCQTRDTLLSSMSGGGRHGFGAPYTSQGCFYRWYTNAEICEILARFDGVLFVGDDALADAYAGFNILLRQDLKRGSLKEWEMSSYMDTKCQCNSQFTSPACSSSRITSSEELYAEGGKKTQIPYTCSTNTPHAFLSVTGSPAPSTAHNEFKSLLARSSEKKQPIAVIQSLSLSTSYSLSTATKSIDEWLTLAKTSARRTPFLWIGPTAPGHQTPPEDNVHANSWQYTQETAQVAQSKGVDVLGMYNATLQAESWDGMRYGEEVAVMQAMMVR
ncbi:hypothetical protein ASPSYDRAFT_202684 [Aspergillus sydowii CBS 593.65]|uniref:Uncharacterized protein n=1 Tax=Aspergillus sydowii CBS 593.65 TaxID=1036612 RepID=A0A1L9THK8_9EURO|nr:uncharacterized protein ASPSYDRAFT_202684 [Aspergillus sydowii CBS 593.65]OJJ58908.1 hypothetical protein ASPSYDRAFT_202684 [Aspergillus sydowii CBS 593.65]